MFEPININGRVFPVEVCRKPVRTAIGRVRGGSVVITIPERMNRLRAAMVARSLYTRLAKGLASSPERYLPLPPIEFWDGQAVRLIGREMRVRAVECTDISMPRGLVDGGEVVVRIPSSYVGDRRALVSRLGWQALSRVLGAEVVADVGRLNSQYFGSRVDRVRLRRMEWTWGSYSDSTKTITLNFRLLYAPAEILEYVIVHELAHTRVRRHGKRFWAEVARVLPDYRQRRRWLREHAHELGSTMPSGVSGGFGSGGI